jgi:hypothetical protein
MRCPVLAIPNTSKKLKNENQENILLCVMPKHVQMLTKTLRGEEAPSPCR